MDYHYKLFLASLELEKVKYDQHHKTYRTVFLKNPDMMIIL